MRALPGLLILVALLAACGAPFGDGASPAPPAAPVAANPNAATATSVLATATRGATGTAAPPSPRPP